MEFLDIILFSTYSKDDYFYIEEMNKYERDFILGWLWDNDPSIQNENKITYIDSFKTRVNITRVNITTNEHGNCHYKLFCKMLSKINFDMSILEDGNTIDFDLTVPMRKLKLKNITN